MGIGVLSLIYGIVSPSISGQRIWASTLINGWFFFGIGLTATFFIAVNAAAQAGWVVVFKRVFEAVSMFVPIGAVLMLIVILGAAFGMNHLYHWMHAPGDPLIEGKKAYLNIPFWLGRTVIFLAVYVFMTLIFRKRSLQEDTTGDTVGFFKRNRVLAAIFFYGSFLGLVNVS